MQNSMIKYCIGRIFSYSDINQKKTFLGYFDKEEEGAKAFNNFVISHNLQEFVDLNII